MSSASLPPNSGADQERRERLRRERERQRTGREQRASQAPAPRRAPRAKPATKQVAATRTRERHEGFLSWVIGRVRAIPDAIAAGARGFLTEVVGIFRSLLFAVVRRIPGGRLLLERTSTRSGSSRGHTITAERPLRARPERSPEEIARRAKRALLVRRRMRVVVGAAVLAVAVAAWFTVPSLGAFRISHVEVLGASSVSDLDVRSRIDEVIEGETIYTVDAESVAERIEQLPFVESARVDGHFPNGLSIEITEYQPLALALGDGSSWLVSRDGRILSKADQDDWQGRIPVVRLRGTKLAPGVRVSDEPSLQVLEAIPTRSTLSFDLIELSGRQLIGRLDSGVEVRFGRPAGVGDLLVKVAAAEAVMTYARTRAKVELSYIEVSVPERPAYCAKKVGSCNVTAVEQAELDAAAKETASTTSTAASSSEPTPTNTTSAVASGDTD